MKWKSPFLSDLRNKLGTTIVGSVWKGRNYFRSYVVPSNPKTLSQQAHRDAMAKAVVAWQVIAGTPANVTAWNANALAELISGFNKFVKDFVGSPIAPDDYSAAAVTKFSGENLTIPRNELLLIVDVSGTKTAYVPDAVGGTAPAWEVLEADMPAYVPANGDKIYVGDNRVFADTVDQGELDAKSTSNYEPDEATGAAVECVLTA